MSTSGATLTVGNLVLDATINLATLDLGFQQLQSRIKQLESTTKIKISIDTSALDGGITKATQQLQNLQRIASAPTVLKVDSAQVTAATAAVTNHATAQKSAQTEITKTTQAVQQHSAAHASLQSAIGGTSQALQVATMQMGGFGQAVNVASMASSGFIGPLGLVVGGLAALTLGLGASAKAAVDFQSTVVTVANNTQMTNAELATMQEGVKQLALVIPASTTAMAEGWRHAADEGFNAADSLKIVNAASMAAVNTGAQVTDTIFLVSQVLHAYHEPATNAMLVTNQLVEAAKQGNTTFAQMAQSIGPLIAQAASLHIPLQGIVAAMSSMTQNGYPADQAVTGLTNLLKEVEAPSQKAKDAIAALGDRGKALVDDFTPAGLAGKGLYGVMKDLGTATDGDNAKILAILPQLRGFRSGVVLAGTGLDDYTKAMNTQADVMSGKLKPTQEDFARTMETVGAKMQILKNTVEVLAIDLDTIFLPILTKVVQGIIDFAQSIGLLSGASGFKDVKKQIQDVNDSYAQTKTAQDAVAAANVTSGNTAAAAGVKSADAAQAHTDALANVRTAAGALDAALGFPNGQQGIANTVANLGTLEQSARDQAARAVAVVNDALALPNGSIGPKDAASFIGELKDAGAIATQVIEGLNAKLAANKALLDQNAAAIQNVKNTYDPIIKGAEQHIRDINLLSPEELARKQRELELDKQKAALELSRPSTSAFDTAITADKTSLDAMPRLDTGKWDDAIKADDKNLKSFDVSSYTAATQKQIDTLQDTDVAAPFKKQAQDIQDAMASLDPEAATKSITDTIQAIRDKSAALDPEAATRNITDTIQGIRDRMAALDPEAATHGITSQIQAIQDQIHGLNTSELDQKIADIKDKLSAPAPDTHGITNQLKELEAQLAGKQISQTDFDARYGALSRQKQGINQTYADSQTSGKGALTGLTEQRDDLRRSQAETKRADEAKIVDLTRQATLIKEGIADEKRADESKIVSLTRQATQIKEGITDQKAADAARIVQLTRQATAIKEGIADERKADETKLRGIARDQAAAEKTKATSLATLADTLKGEQATAAADKKKIDVDRAWNQEQKANAVDLDRDARQKLTDDITHQERLKTAMLAPYTQQLAGITAQQQQNTLLDATAAAQRKLDLAPYLAQLDQAKQKETDELAPLLAKKQELDGIKTKLDEEKATWGGIKSAIDSAKSSLDNYFKLPTGGGDPAGANKSGAGTPPVVPPSALTGNAAFADAGGTGVDTGLVANVPKSPIQIQMEGLKTWLDTNIPDMLNKLKLEAKLDLKSLFDGVDFVKNVAEVLSDLEQHKFGDAFEAAKRLLGGGGSNSGGGAFIGPPVPAGFGSPVDNTLRGVSGGKASEQNFVDNNKNLFGELFGGLSDKLTKALDSPWLGGQGDGAGSVSPDNAAGVGSWGTPDSAASGPSIIDRVLGTQSVGAADLSGQIGEIDQFTQHIQDSLGDNGGAQAAIQSFKDQVTTAIGNGSDPAQAVRDAEKSFTDAFGSGNAVPTSFADTGTAAQQTFGNGGDVATAFAQNDNGVVDTTRTLDTAAGSWGDAYAQTGQDATKHLGAGGTVDTAYTNATTGTTDLVGTLDNASTKMGGAYGTTANAATKNLGKGGVADTANTDLVSSLDNASQQGQGALTTLNGGVTGTATNATSQFGPGGPADAAHKNLTTSIQSAQTNGTTALGTLDSSVTGTATNATSQFGAGGTTDRATQNLAASMNTSQTQADGSLALLDNAVSGTANGVGTNLGAGGATDRHLSSFGATTSSTASGAVGDFGSIDAAVLATGGPAGSIISNLTVAGNWLQTTWQGISPDISKPFTDAWPAIDGFFKSLSTGLEWLATNFKLSFVKYQGADTGFIGPIPTTPAPTTGGGGPTNAYANGLSGGKPGHWATIGERGPEVMYIPPNASIIPNHLLPGHADGLNMDGLLAGMGGALAHNGDKLIDGMMGALGTPTIPGIEGAGAALGTQLTAGLHEWMKGSLINNPPAAARAGSRAGGITGAGDLIAAVLAATGDKGEQMAMLMGAFLETSGRNVAQDGGPGRGYWQIEAGPGGSHPDVTEAQAFDPMFAARYMLRDYDAAMGYFDPSNLEASLAEVVYRAEKPADRYPPDRIANAWNAIQAFLVNGGIAAPSAGAAGSGGGGYMLPAQGTVTQEFGQTGFYLEPGGFHDGLDIANVIGTSIVADANGQVDQAGWNNYGFGNWVHLQHANGIETWMGHMSQVLTDVGAIVQKGQEIGLMGSTGASTGSHVHWGAHQDGQKIDPLSLPGLATGGYFDHESGPYMIGEGHDPEGEVASPVQMLRQVVKEESGSGGAPSFTFEAGAITVMPDGSVTVDQSRVHVTSDILGTARSRGWRG